MFQRFMDKVNSDWQWTAGKHREGYGEFCIDGKEVYAHRVSYELFVGPIPEGMDILHSCDDPGCVNPEHLHPGTHSANMHEMSERKRIPSGEKHNLSKMTQVQVNKIREDWNNNKIKSIRECAEEYSVNYTTIWNIIYNKTWK